MAHCTEHANPLELCYRNDNPLRTLWNLIYGDRVKLLISVVFFVIKLSPEWLWPIVLGQIINVVSPPRGELWEAMAWGGVWTVMLLLNLPTHTLHMKLLALVIRHAETRLRWALVHRMQQLSMAVHDDLHTGVMHAKVLRDVEAIQQLAQTLIGTMLAAMVMFTVAVVTTLFKEPRVTLLFVITAPLTVGLARLFHRRIRQRNHELRTEIEQMSSRVSEMLNMLPITRAHGAEQEEVQRVGQQIDRVRESGIRVDVLNALFNAASWVILMISQLICLSYTCWLAWHGRIQPGDVVTYQALFVMLQGSIGRVLQMYPQLMRGFESIRSLGEILECPDLEENEGKMGVERVDGEFQFEDVSFEYPQSSSNAVEGFDLTVHRGECIALVGESGAGKSTIISLVIGFRRPTSGRILLDGVDMQDLDLRTYRRHIAVVPQETILFSGSVRENITYGTSGLGDADVARAVEIANLTDVIEKLPHGLDTIVGEGGSKLSGGQRQRLAIARAVIRDPRVLLLDEATSSLDVVSESAVQEAINRAIQGRTTFIVAHRLSTIRQADRIIVMQDGHCIEKGTHEELLTLDGHFARLKALQT